MFGERNTPWHWRGYKGENVGGIRWGERPDGLIVILSGIDAQAFWSTFAPFSTNCSRVDLAATVELPRCNRRVVQEHLSMIRDEMPARKKKFNCTHVENVVGVGETLYIGSRASDQFGRVYDKGAQMGDPRLMHRLWRYEVEFKDARAKTVLRSLYQDHASPCLAGVIRATVYNWFVDRLVIPPFDPTRQAGVSLELSAKVVSDSQSLAWLSKQVRPTVARLMARNLTAEVAAALGLEDVFSPVEGKALLGK